MKRVVSLLFALTFIVGTMGVLTSCGGKDGKKGKDSSTKKEIAFILDEGSIDDGAFHQGAWEGVKKYAEENNKTYKYYRCAERSSVASLSSIDQAVKAGAKMIICPGFFFEGPVFKSQTKYPDVKFVTLDCTPKETQDSEPVITENTLAVLYAENESGYLAGYAAVKDGYKNLAVMGGMPIPPVVNFGFGFVQGADVAAKELGMKKGDVKIKYTYLNNFVASPENQAKAAAFFNDKTDIIFGCGGDIINSIMKAAESNNKKVIGVDSDGADRSKTVVTSAMKNVTGSVYNVISDYYNNKFEGGKIIVLGAAQDGVQLPMDTSRFKTFNKKDYDKVYATIADGSVKVLGSGDVKSVSELSVEVVSVEVV